MLEEKKRQRCVIYTRKSSEQGLEHEFNSLDAQREACVRSQASLGWSLVPGAFDDGGLSIEHFAIAYLKAKCPG
jgi:site-specific DNA recombinase